jgi:ribonuclease G
LSRHPGPEPLFDATGVTQDVEKALRPRVWLKSGGTLVIQQTEALVSIDVNTGKFVGTRHPEETILKTNVEAAAEIARQLRLRDLAGIIVIDFIDMERPEHRAQVIDALATALKRDRARTKIVGLSDLGLLQLTRKRTRAGLEALLTRPCPGCSGSGRQKTPETVALEALVEVRRVATAFPQGTLTVKAHPEVAHALRLAIQIAGPIVDATLAGRLRVVDDAATRADQFDVSAL